PAGAVATAAAIPRLVRFIVRREAGRPSILGPGIAIPAARHRDIARQSGVIGRCGSPAAWIADTAGVCLVVLLVCPEDRPGDGLRHLVHVAETVRRLLAERPAP
ncbi:MAG: PTS sugar transporter subunit IIA, partial [Gemmataceae bacterium]|nr:PTS sugar transporter subunit IIA [Gemmataceae bacterium]